jgi:hypothetical protein
MDIFIVDIGHVFIVNGDLGRGAFIEICLPQGTQRKKGC